VPLHVEIAEGVAVVESDELARLMSTGEHQARMDAFVAAGGQSREAQTTRMQAVLDATLEA